MKNRIGIVLVVAGLLAVVFSGQLGRMFGADTTSVGSGSKVWFQVTVTSSKSAKNWTYGIAGAGLVAIVAGAWMLVAGSKKS